MVRRLIVMLAPLLVSCGPGVEPETTTDGGVDADTDTDTDADTDTDTDADTDTGTDTCPEQDYQVIDLATGQSHTCVVLDGGGVKCWGSNQFGKLGYPLEDDLCTGQMPADCPVVDVGGPVARIAVGAYHTCAMLESGVVKCWGYDATPTGSLCYGVLGDETVPACGFVDAPSTVEAWDVGHPATSISSSAFHTSLVTEEGEVFTWGCKCYSACTPDTVDTKSFGQPVVQSSTGGSLHCVLLQGGEVYCWGYNSEGQLGYGHTDFVAAAQVPDQVGPVELGGPAVQVAAGGDHTCAILEGGGVVCWGHNSVAGQLGYGNTENVGDDELPADVGTVDVGEEVVQMSLGNTSTCAVLSDGSLKCWGYWSYEAGEVVGDDESPADVDPIDVGGPVTRVSAGGSHICAVMASGAIRCWGSNSYGQLGYGDAVSQDEYIGDDEPPSSLCEVPVM